MFGLIRTTIIALVLAFNAGSILAQDFQKGVAAYQSGDYVTALQEWRPLAEQGPGTTSGCFASGQRLLCPAGAAGVLPAAKCSSARPSNASPPA